MKLLTYIFAFAYLFTLEPLQANKQSESGIAVIVNEKSILKSDLKARMRLVAKSSGLEFTPAYEKQAQDRVLQQMIDEVLQMEIVKKVDMEPKADQIKDAWQKMEKNAGLNDGELEKQLAAEHIPRRIVEDQIIASMGWGDYINERYRNVVQVNDSEVKNEVARLKNAKESDQALLSEIVLYYDSPEKAEETKAKASQISAKLRSGAPFPVIAQQYSHSASAARGGDIGWVTLDKLDPNIKLSVAKLKQGEISEPIPVKGGYYIMGMRERHGVGSLGQALEYVSVQQVEFLFPMFGDESAMQDTYVKAKSTHDQAKTCSMLKKLTTDRPRVKSQFVERQRVDAFHPELSKLLKKLQPGQKSELMNTGQSLIMFMLCDRKVVEPHEPGEDEIRRSLFEKKLEQISEREIRNLRRAAHIVRKI